MELRDSNHQQRFPRRAVRWQLKTRELTFDRIPLLMGIVNVTPDSFSDGGRFLDPQAAIAQALQLVADGADILDIGGESARPNSEPVSASEELRRVLPVIEGVVAATKVPVSIDTSKAIVAQTALAAGAEIVNDITALNGDPGMLNLLHETGAGVCVMHMQGTPQTMQDNPTYGDVVRDIEQFLGDRLKDLVEAGIVGACICLDPGIGFGKTYQHNLTLMANCWQFHSLGCPLVVGHSRKGFLGKLLGDSTADRAVATAGAALSLARQGVQIVRIHDVQVVREALLAFEATGGIDVS